MKFCDGGSNFRRKSRAVLEYAFKESQKYTPKDEGLSDIGNSMSIGI